MQARLTSFRATIGSMGAFPRIAAAYGKAAFEAVAETLWPTRCAVCDLPGMPLCDSCRRDLPYIDWWRACPRCGAPFGRVQCSECNEVILASLKRKRPPFASCASVVVFGGTPARIIHAYKDQGERRLAREIAAGMTRILHPIWTAEHPTIVAVPATRRAVRQRGFDHMELVAREIASRTGFPISQPLARPRRVDQRSLSRTQRIENMEGSMITLPGASIPSRILLVDDVYTTGATLFAATDALLRAGARQVRCLTYARVWR